MKTCWWRTDVFLLTDGHLLYFSQSIEVGCCRTCCVQLSIKVDRHADVAVSARPIDTTFYQSIQKMEKKERKGEMGNSFNHIGMYFASGSIDKKKNQQED